jgi:hypothetical protein
MEAVTATSSRLVCRLAKWIVCRWVVDSISLYLMNASLATGLADGGGRLAGGDRLERTFRFSQI